MRRGGARRGWALALALALLPACGASRSSWVGEQGAAEYDAAAQPMSAQALRALIERVAYARQLDEKRPITIEQLDARAFAARVRKLLQEAGEGDQPTDSGANEDAQDPTAALLLGLNLVPPPEQRDGISTSDEVLQEQIAAFYDAKTDVVVMPIKPIRDEDDDLQRRAVLAHEVHHALQRRHFDIAELPESASLDKRLAHGALIEGDAMVAMGAYLGLEHDLPLRRTLRVVNNMVRNVNEDKLHKATDARLQNALPIMRKALLFPYHEGLSFVTDLYRAGGFPLVNRAYERPPQSSMHVLHTQKYIDGINPSTYPPLPQLPGLTVKHQLSLGELVTRVVLERCNAPRVAAKAASGWLGDTMAMGTGPRGEGVALWLSNWESERDAAAMAAALNRPACWRANRDDDLRVAATFSVMQRQTRVVLVRGADPQLAATWMQPLLSLIPKPVAPTPIARATVPTRRALPIPQPGSLRGNHYRSDWLGIEAQIPPNMAVRLNEDDLELRISRPGIPIGGIVALSERRVAPGPNERAFRQLAAGFARGGEVFDLQEVARGDWPSPLGPSHTRTWGSSGSSLRMRAVLIPICGGTGSLLIMQVYSNPFDEKVLVDWLQSFRWLSDAPKPVCQRLDPK